MAITTTYSIQAKQAAFVADGLGLGTRIGPDMIRLANGGYAISYGVENPNPAGNNLPRIAIYDAENNLVGDRLLSDDVYFYMRGTPKLTLLADGNIAAVWDEGPAGGNGLFGTIIDPANGNVVQSKFTVSPFGQDMNPKIAALPDGTWVVMIQDQNGIVSQRMSADGERIGPQARLYPMGPYSDPSITVLADGGYVVTYTVDVPNAKEIGATIFNANGTVRKAHTIIGDFGNNTDSAVAALPDGRWAVVYADNGWGSSGLSLQIFNADGTASSDLIRVDVNLADVEKNPRHHGPRQWLPCRFLDPRVQRERRRHPGARIRRQWGACRDQRIDWGVRHIQHWRERARFRHCQFLRRHVRRGLAAGRLRQRDSGRGQ